MNLADSDCELQKLDGSSCIKRADASFLHRQVCPAPTDKCPAGELHLYDTFKGNACGRTSQIVHCMCSHVWYRLQEGLSLREPCTTRTRYYCWTSFSCGAPAPMCWQVNLRSASLGCSLKNRSDLCVYRQVAIGISVDHAKRTDGTGPLIILYVLERLSDGQTLYLHQPLQFGAGTGCTQAGLACATTLHAKARGRGITPKLHSAELSPYAVALHDETVSSQGHQPFR